MSEITGNASFTPIRYIDGSEWVNELNKGLTQLGIDFKGDIKSESDARKSADALLQTSISAEETARKNEIDIERKRIDTIASLPSGSTTGDLELIDARLGADGVTYTNLGSAIRTQVSQLSDEITNFETDGSTLENIDFVRGTIAGTGANYTSAIHWVTNNYIKFDADTIKTILVPSGLLISVWRYNTESDVFVNAAKVDNLTADSSFIFLADKYYHITVKINGDLTANVTAEQKNGIVFKTDSTFKTSVDNKINEVSNRVDTLESDYITPYTTQEQSIIDSFYKIQNANTITFGLITDIHAGIQYWDNLYNHQKVMNHIAEKCGVDFCINLGDSFSDVADHSENLKRLHEVLKCNNAYAIPNLYCEGNHEEFVQSDSSLALEKWQVIAQTKNSRYIEKKPHGTTYYYFDLRNTRFIVLDSSSNTNNGFSDEQCTWFDTALQDAPEKVVIFTHIPFDASLMLQATPKNADLIKASMQTYKNKILCVFHGHTHWDNVAVLDDITYISTCCALSGKQSLSGYTGLGTPTSYDRSYGTYTEYCIDMVCIDVYAKTVKMYRFGAGSNRNIDC